MRPSHSTSSFAGTPLGGRLLRILALPALAAVTLVLADDISAALETLAGRGVTRLLVEGGATVAQAFADVADRLELFTAPGTLGDNAGGDISALPLNFVRVNQRMLGPDTLESYVRRA